MTVFNSAALALFLLLAPGFLAVTAFYSFGALSRHDHQRGMLYDAATLVFISAFCHVLVSLGMFFACWYFFGIARTESLLDSLWNWNEAGPFSWTRNRDSLLFALAYLFLIVFVPFIMGALLIKAIEKGKYPIFRSIGRRSTHGALYDLIQGRKMPLGHDRVSAKGAPSEIDFDYLIASAMVNIVIGNRIVVYRGLVAEIILGDKRQVESISLQSPLRFLVKVKDDFVETQGVKDYRSVFSSDEIAAGGSDEGQQSDKNTKITPHLLVIKGSQILNLSFERKQFTLSTDGIDELGSESAD